MFTLMQMGGWLMWPILVCAVLAAALVVERLMYLRCQELNVGEFLSGLIRLLEQRRYTEALARCDEAHGPVAQIVHSAIEHRDLPRMELRELVREVAQLQVPRLEHNLGALGTIGNLTPLLGLLGTVCGLIQAFMQVQARGGVTTPSDLADGVWQALITTAAGLAISVPALAAYNYIVGRVGRLINDMERACVEIVQVLTARPAVIPYETSNSDPSGGADAGAVI
jgi:biopolymer transport protein ExbB